MNKHYDKYLCRATPREFCKIYTDTFGREYVYIGVDKYFLSKPYTSGDVEICDLTPAEEINCSETENWVAKTASWSLSIVMIAVFVGMIIKMCLK